MQWHSTDQTATAAAAAADDDDDDDDDDDVGVCVEIVIKDDSLHALNVYQQWRDCMLSHLTVNQQVTSNTGERWDLGSECHCCQWSIQEDRHSGMIRQCWYIDHCYTLQVRPHTHQYLHTDHTDHVNTRSVLFWSSFILDPWTNFLHLSLSSVILTDSSTGSPVHALMLSIQVVCGLPRLRAPDIVPCIISFSRQLPCFLMVWP